MYIASYLAYFYSMKLLGFFQVMFIYVNQWTVMFSPRCAMQSCFSFHSLPTNKKKYAYINVVKGAANSSNTIDNSPRNTFKNSYSCSEYNVMSSVKWYIQMFDSLSHVSENSKLLIFSFGLDHLSDYTQIKRQRSHSIEST